MRLLLISKYYTPYKSARALQIRKVFESVVNSGIDTIVIAGVPTLDIETTSNDDRVFYLPYWNSSNGTSSVSRAYTKIRKELQTCWSISGWVPNAVSKGLKLIDEHKINCIMSSSTPFESHLVGLKIKKKTGLPWVASFSDPWPSFINPFPYYRHGLIAYRNVQMRLLKKVLKESSVVHMPSSYAIQLIEKSTKNHISHKAVVIPHIGTGYHGLVDNSEQNGLLVHVGHLSRERVSESLLLGIKMAHQEIPDRFRGLLCVGTVCPEFRIAVKKLQLNHLFKFTGYLPVEDAIKLSCDAKALLVIEADMSISPYLPSKFADYTQLGKPILAITPSKSAISDYLRLYGGGIAVQNDKTEISNALITIFSSEIEDKQLTLGSLSPLGQIFSKVKVGNQYVDAFEKVQREK